MSAPLSWPTADVIETHTAGEPTRVVISGGPDLGDVALPEQRRLFQERHDDFRSALMNEPRGADCMVGALLTTPRAPECLTGVIFFNNVGALNMCGHGTMGVMVALAHLGRVAPGRHRLETSAGIVSCELLSRNRVAVENVPSFRFRANVKVPVEGYGSVMGDVAWGGNWFFLTEHHPCDLLLRNIPDLTAYGWAVRRGLSAAGITGAAGAEIDHIEISGPAHSPANHSRNFVLCPGGAYDRSPCGTGTSAKLACLMAEGSLSAGQVYRQEGMLGGCFEAVGQFTDQGILPLITGSAYVNAETRILFDPDDPFRHGIRPDSSSR